MDKELKRIMSVPPVDLSNIWFVNDQHREQFLELCEQFKAPKDPEYAAACYVFAHPEIFWRINWPECKDNPTTWYWGEWVPEGTRPESEIVGQLSSSYRGLVRAAVEMFTSSSQHFNFMIFLNNAGDEVYKLFVQAMEIRRFRHLIDLHETN